MPHDLKESDDIRLLMPTHVPPPRLELWLGVMASALVPAISIIFVPEVLQRPMAITAAVLLAAGSCILIFTRRHQSH